jgi:ribosomal protein L16 Arg81 hydroxylase
MCSACATGGSYTAPHVDFYGADAFLHLVSGEKLWLLAPPEKEAEFLQLFQRPQRGATIRLSKADTLRMAQHRMRVIHQRAGEAVFVPGGWAHMVKNLSATVSFGNSYLRPWRLPALLAFVRQQGLAQASRLVDVVGVVRAWMDETRQREWGVSADEAALVLRQWGAWIKAHVVPGA